MTEIINYSTMGKAGKKMTYLGEFEAPLHIICKLLNILHSKQRIIKEFSDEGRDWKGTTRTLDLPDPPASPRLVQAAALVAASPAAADART